MFAWLSTRGVSLLHPTAPFDASSYSDGIYSARFSIDHTSCCTGFVSLDTGLHLHSSLVTDGAIQGNSNGDGIVLWNGDPRVAALNHQVTVQAGDTSQGSPTWHSDQVLSLPDPSEGSTVGQSGYLLGMAGPSMHAGNCVFQAASPTSAAAGIMEDSGFECNQNILFPTGLRWVGWASGSFVGTLSSVSLSASRSWQMPDADGNVMIGAGASTVKASTALLTFTAIAAATCQEQTGTDSGASLSGNAFASPSTDLGSSGLLWSARMSTGNLVSVRVCNITSGPITPTAVDWNLTVIQ